MGLPPTVLEEIFMSLAAGQVICVCRLVCHEWKDVVDRISFWKQRCRREGLQTKNANKTLKEWQTYYVLSKKRRNLLRNPNAEDGFSNWEILQNGGDQWYIENMFAPHSDETLVKCFVSSSRSCLKSQLIDLVQEGYSPILLDEEQPHIVMSDWYAPWPRGCGCEYHIWVELLNSEKQTIQKFQPPVVTFPQCTDLQWKQMTHIFKNYGPGLRYVRFTHGGKGTKFWVEWYGIRVTNSSVEVIL